MLTVKGVIREFFTDKKTGQPYCSVQSVYRMVRLGQIPCVKVGRRVFFSEKAIKQWADGRITAQNGSHVIPE